MNDTAQGPIAVSQPVGNSGVNVAAPVVEQSFDPALDRFTKIAAERRTRFGQEPIRVPFGSSVLRIHRTMPAAFAVDISMSQSDPAMAIEAIRSVVLTDDLPEFERILRLPPDNAEGIDGDFLLAFLEVLAEFYGGVPLDA